MHTNDMEDTMNIDPQKYIVFKRDDLHDALDALYPAIEDRTTLDAWNAALHGVALDDAVVIRRQDVFAHSALYAYAASIQSVVEVLELSGVPGLDDRVDYLRSLADFFAGQADQSRQAQSHLPTPDRDFDGV